MTLYPDRPERPRLAVFARYDFPRVDEAALYERLDALAASLGADYRVVHSVVTDPRHLSAPMRARSGSGLFVLKWRVQHDNDLRHCQHSLPERFAALLADLERFAGVPAAQLLARDEVREAFSFARQVRAFGAAAVLSYGLEEGAFPAFVAARLLALPHVLLLPPAHAPHEYGQLLPLYAASAHALIALGPGVAETMAARLRPAAPIVTASSDVADAVVRSLVARALAQPRAAAAPALGPAAAFVTRPGPPAPTRCRRFVVLGTERTGSNMLVGMLVSRSGIVCAGELFNARAIDDGEMFWFERSGPDTQELVRLRAEAPAALLARLWRDGAARGADLVGYKLLYLQGEADDRIIDALAGDRDLAVVHLLRADRLQRFLSFERARVTDAWFAAAGAAPLADDAPLRLDCQLVATEFTMNAQQEQRYRAVFRRHAVCELDYADLAGRLPWASQRLGEFFGRDLGVMVPGSRKTGPTEAKRGIANLADLRSAFAGTGWAGLFD